MPVNLKCPKCLYEYDYRQAAKDKAIVQMLGMMPEFAPHSGLVLEYLELFETTRPLKPAKLLRIMTEMRDIWTAGQFGFQKRAYDISRQGIAQALKTVCNKRFDVALENHNYLKKVMISVAEQEAQKRSVDAERALKEKEARLRASTRPESPEQIERPASIGDLTKKLPWRKE